MGDRSTLDRLAIGAVFIAGIVEAAQQALANAPAVTRAHPVLKLDPAVWNYVPLWFIAAATLLWVVDQGLRIFRPSYARARQAPPEEGGVSSPAARAKINWDGDAGVMLVILLAVCLIAGFIALIVWGGGQREKAVQAEPQMKSLPVLRGQVTLAFVRQTIQTQDAVTAEQTLSKYLGTPMRVSGTVHDNLPDADYSHLVQLTDPKAVPQVYLLFDQSQSDLPGYTEGEHIAAACKIERLDASGLGLDGCALIHDEAWTGAPVTSASH